MIAILDYKAGNQTSVYRALMAQNIDCIITDSAEILLNADGVIFPGVGAAAQAMDYLLSHKLDCIIKEIVEQKIPLLGLCLGAQILLGFSEESNTKTLGIVEGSCVAFQKDLKDGNKNINIPHMGWNALEIKKESPLFEGIESGDEFYFVHSYYNKVAEELILATTNYGLEFASIYGKDGLWAVQCHPEKSGAVGLKLLKNFASYCYANKENIGNIGK